LVHRGLLGSISWNTGACWGQNLGTKGLVGVNILAHIGFLRVICAC
jgi:hypothetical protein